jgi:hypothetical protein
MACGILFMVLRMSIKNYGFLNGLTGIVINDI